MAGGINTYAYVGGNPLSRADRKGLLGEYEGDEYIGPIPHGENVRDIMEMQIEAGVRAEARHIACVAECIAKKGGEDAAKDYLLRKGVGAAASRAAPNASYLVTWIYGIFETVKKRTLPIQAADWWVTCELDCEACPTP